LWILRDLWIGFCIWGFLETRDGFCIWGFLFAFGDS
jgi:hypothetical protein